VRIFWHLTAMFDIHRRILIITLRALLLYVAVPLTFGRELNHCWLWGTALTTQCLLCTAGSLWVNSYGILRHGYKRLERAIHRQVRRHFCPEDGGGIFLRKTDNEQSGCNVL